MKKKKARRGRGKRSYAKASCPVPVRTRRIAGGPWIQREGKLGGPGYTKKSDRERHRLLNCSIERFGYRSTMGSLLVLLRGHPAKKVRSVILQDVEWLKSHG